MKNSFLMRSALKKRNENGLSQTEDLGRAQSRYRKAGQQQGLQQKEITGMEVGTAADQPVIFLLTFPSFSITISSEYLTATG